MNEKCSYLGNLEKTALNSREFAKINKKKVKRIQKPVVSGFQMKFS